MSVVFSVITITYNAAPVLQRTLDSVARQTYEGVEHIIVDGASKDETVAMAEKYKEQSDQADNGHEVRILSEPDKGLYDAMNGHGRLHRLYERGRHLRPSQNLGNGGTRSRDGSRRTKACRALWRHRHRGWGRPLLAT